MKTLVIIPTYNERDNIEELIHEILSLNLDIHILVVDDDSYDGTAESLRRVADCCSNVSVIHRYNRRGRGLAGIEGFKWALAQMVDYIIEMDGDFSHDPQYIPIFLREIKDCDVVIGSRRIKDGRVLGRPWLRNYLGLLAQLFCRIMLGINILDATSGFRCFRKYVLQELDLDNLLSKGPSIVEEINYHLKKRGFKIKEVPIVFRQRRRGSSKLNLLKILDAFYTIIRVRLAGR